MFKHILSYVPAIAVALLLGTVLTIALWRQTVQPTTVTAPEFKPVQTLGLKFCADAEDQDCKVEAHGPFVPGQVVTVKNGVCNTSKQTLQVITIVGFEETRVDRIVARNVVVSPRPDASAPVSPLPRPLEPDCTAKGLVTGLMPNVPPGNWKLYVTLTIMGPQSGQVQRVNVTSGEIEVRAVGSQ